MYQLKTITTLLFFCLLTTVCQARELPELQQLLIKSKQDTTRISLLLETGMLYVNRPGAEKNDMDSALYYTNMGYRLSQALKDIRWQGKCWYVYSYIYREQGKIKEGKASIQKAISLLSEAHATSDLANAYLEFANYYQAFVDSELSYKILYNKQALLQFEKGGESRREADVLYNLADLYQIETNYDTAILTLEKILAIDKKINNPSTQYIYDLMGDIYGITGNFTKQISNAMLAVQTAEAVNDTSVGMITIYNRSGIAFSNAEQYSQEAIKYFKKALETAIKYHDTGSIYTVTPNLIKMYTDNGMAPKAIQLLKFIEKTYPPKSLDDSLQFMGTAMSTYLQIKDLTHVKPYQQKLLQISNSLPVLSPLQISTFDYLIQYYLVTKQYKEAEKFCRYNDSLYKHLNYMRGICSNYLTWFRADSAAGNYSAALKHFIQYTTIQDSLFNLAKNKQVTQLKLKYETAQKEKDIQLLTKQSQLQKTELRQTQLTKNFLLGGAGMLSLLLGLGYNRYRLKQRSNDTLKMQQNEINQKNESLERFLKEKEWLVKEMHHRVKNNLQIVISLLNSQSMYLDNEAAIGAIKESQHRMHAMSLIHQKLYQSEEMTLVNMPSYICELTEYLHDGAENSKQPAFKHDIDDISLDIAQAIPVGLILNEAITNALKYAFTGNNTGIITISMKKTDTQTIRLIIADNGSGLPASYDSSKSNSLGMSLIKGLANQLGGNYSINSGGGVKIEIEFPYVNGLNVS